MAVGCASEGDDRAPRGTDPNAPPPGGVDPNAPPIDPISQCTGKEYVGFDQAKLTETRVGALSGTDQRRVKAFSVLRTEFPRVLGNTPASLQPAASTFGAPAARWDEEPTLNAVALQTAYSIAFDGCLTFTAQGAEYANAPDAANAPAVCGALQRKFWSQTATPAEIAACSKVAVVDAAAEPDARRRWAYACASVLTASGFMSY
jgi:hypothetical protein